MAALLTTVLTAIVSGAMAKAKNVTESTISNVYENLKTLVNEKLGKVGALLSVEDDPDSKPAQEALAVALDKGGAVGDQKIQELAKTLIEALKNASPSDTGPAGNIDIASVQGHVNATVEKLVAEGHITVGPVVATTGDAVVRNVTAGAGPAKKNVKNKENSTKKE